MDLFNKSLTTAGVSCNLVETSHAELLAFYKSLEAPETVASPAEAETVATDEETTATPADDHHNEETTATPAEAEASQAEPVRPAEAVADNNDSHANDSASPAPIAETETDSARPAEPETTYTTPAETGGTLRPDEVKTTGGLSAETETATDEPRPHEETTRPKDEPNKAPVTQDEPHKAEPVRTSASASPSYFVACLKAESVKPAQVSGLNSATLPTFDSLPTFGAFYLSSCVSVKDLQAVGDGSGSFKASEPGKACRYSAILSGPADVAPVNTS